MAITLPSTIQPIWNELHGDVAWLHWRWHIYRQLFGTSPERIQFLNECAATFFGMLQNVLLDDVQLGLSKLGDPSQTGKHRNITLATLADAIAGLNEPALNTQLQSAITAYQSKSARVRDRRNKRIAHLDFNTSMQRASAGLPQPSRQEIDEALEALRKFMNVIAARFGNTQIFYEASAPDAAAYALLLILKGGMRHREMWNDEGSWLEDLQKSRYFRV
ncbi:hypothetical protein EPO44_18870 [bacterium]|nr:MAG: hypothetical protein EPO44_18870 [bacterium]